MADIGEKIADAAPKPVAGALVAFAVVLPLEVLLLVYCMHSTIAPLMALALHISLMAAMTWVLRRRVFAGADDGIALLGLLATLATGPFGAAGALLLPFLARRNAATEERLAAWYQRIALSAEQDDFTQLSDRVAVGRSANLAAPVPEAFTELFRSGPLAEQQVALGIIARAFDPGYLPVLKIALESPEPVIRVQAAAVAVRVRSQLQDRVTALFGRAADPRLPAADAAAVASDLDAAMASGLLEQNLQIRAIGVHQALLARTFARQETRARNIAAGVPQPVERGSAAAADAYADHLLANGRFAEFRTARLAFRRPLYGRYRHRLVHARARSQRLRLVPIAVRR